MDDSGITKERLVRQLDSSFLSLALEDMKRALNSNTNLAVFILGACFIDAMASFYTGVTDPKTGGWGERFKDLTRKYLRKYNPEDLWSSLRCGLLHSYTEYGKYAFINKNRQLHFQKDAKDRIIINDENFIEELEQAYQEFRKDILEKDDIFLKAKERFKSLGTMRIRSLDTGDYSI